MGAQCGDDVGAVHVWVELHEVPGGVGEGHASRRVAQCLRGQGQWFGLCDACALLVDDAVLVRERGLGDEHGAGEDAFLVVAFLDGDVSSVLADLWDDLVEEPVFERDRAGQLAGDDQPVHVAFADERCVLYSACGLKGVAFHDPLAMASDGIVGIGVAECGGDVASAVFDLFAARVDPYGAAVECVGVDLVVHGHAFRMFVLVVRSGECRPTS